MNKNFDSVDRDIKSYKKVMIEKAKLDKRREILYGGNGKAIFPDKEKL